MSETPTPVISGDRELHIVNSDQWAFPVYADPYSVPPAELMLVQPAIGHPEAIKELMDVLRPHSAGEAKDGSYRMWIEKSVFLSISSKAPGITPEYYFKWPGVNPIPDTLAPFDPKKNELSTVVQAFVDFLVMKCPALDRTQAVVFMQAFKQYAKEWLGNTKREIDFGIFTVVPLPYRVNWKEILYAQESELASSRTRRGLIPRKWIGMLKITKLKRNEWFEQERQDSLWDTKLMDVSPSDETALWHLNLVEGKQYREYTKQCEKVARSKWGGLNYTKSLVRKISDRRGAILDILSDWASQISRPCGAVVTERDVGGQRLTCYKTSKRTKRAKPYGLPVVVDDSPELVGPEVDQLAVEAEGMRQMLHLQPDEGDLRYEGSNVEQPING